jgi:hypothetical protein
LNPQENIWDEIREKIFKNYALKSMDQVYGKLEEAALYIQRNPKIVKSITSFPYIALCDMELVSDENPCSRCAATNATIASLRTSICVRRARAPARPSPLIETASRGGVFPRCPPRPSDPRLSDRQLAR